MFEVTLDIAAALFFVFLFFGFLWLVAKIIGFLIILIFGSKYD